MKIIFLDIDGVLNSRRSLTAFGSARRLCPVSVHLIWQLCYNNEVRLVLSSSWRYMKNWRDELTDFGGEMILPFIISETPKSISGFRGKEIEQWFFNWGDVTNAAPIQNWAIIDDSKDFYDNQLKKMVRTDPNEGFLYADFVKLCFLLDIKVE